MQLWQNFDFFSSSKSALGKNRYIKRKFPEPLSLLCLALRKYGVGVVEEYALQSNSVDKVQPGRGDRPVEVMGGWAGRLFGDL